MSDNKKRLDIVIFGATGLVGKYAIENLITSIAQDKDVDGDNQDNGIKWAAAGRDGHKVRDTLQQVSTKLAINDMAIDTHIITADINDIESIKLMTSQAKVVVNCVGPFRQFGNVVIESCLSTNTHHVDVSAELQYLEGAFIKYDQRAKEARVLIIGACAFQSLPMEMGVNFMRDKFKDVNCGLNSVDGFMRIIPGPDGWTIGHGTWDSMVTSIGHGLEILETRSELFDKFFKEKVPKIKQKSLKLIPFKTQFTTGLNIPVWDIDMETSKVTNAINHNNCNHERPIFVAKYLTINSLIPILKVLFAAIVFGWMIFINCTRNLLINYPSFFSFGLFSKEGPTDDEINGTKFEMILQAKGQRTSTTSTTTKLTATTTTKINEDNNLKGDGHGHGHKQDMILMGRIRGPEMTYPMTSQCAVQAAITLIKERNLIPFEGGVLTPGTAFRSTNLVHRLNGRNVNPVLFELI